MKDLVPRKFIREKLERGNHRKFCLSKISSYTVYQNTPQLQGYIPQLPYAACLTNEITKYIINPLCDIHICLWVSFLGLKFNKFLGDYLRDSSLIMSKELSIMNLG